MTRLALIGFPVGHSRSPAMQNAALAALGMDDDWSYEAIEVAPEALEAQVLELAGTGEFAGVNVTMPHKEGALALANGRTEAASRIGAANTLSFGPEGWIAADNTDAGGLLAALSTTPLGARALVLGAGGVARAAVWALVGEGARVEVWNRTPERAALLCRQLGGRAVEAPAQAEYDLIVNATSVGLGGGDPFAALPLDRDGFVAGQLVVDMVYGQGEATLLAAAAAAGAETVDGIELLVQQGALSFEIWTGREPDLDVMRAAARAA